MKRLTVPVLFFSCPVLQKVYIRWPPLQIFRKLIKKWHQKAIPMDGFNFKFMKQFICLVLPHWLSLHTFHLYYKEIMVMLDGF